MKKRFFYLTMAGMLTASLGAPAVLSTTVSTVFADEMGGKQNKLCLTKQILSLT